jgi:transcriptional regulator of acetoin/glycerol metabolism
MMKEEFQVVSQTDLSVIRRQLDPEWSKYVIEGIEPVSVRPVILESWHRCRHIYRVDPGAKKSPVSLSQDELLANREQNEALHLARPFLDELTDGLKDTGHVVAFCDEDGWMLEMEGDPRVLAELKEIEDYLGANCKEQFVGTNGAGTALAEKRPVQVLGSEHYVNAWHFLAGHGAPILDPFSHEPVAVIDVAGFMDVAHSHMLSVVSMTAHAIEQKIKQAQMVKDQQIINSHLQLAAGRLSDGLLSIDQHGRIMQINPVATRLLGLPETVDTLEECPELKRVLLPIFHYRCPPETPEEHQIYCSQTDRYLNPISFPVIRENRIIGAIVLIPGQGTRSGQIAVDAQERLARRTGSKWARARYTFEHILGEVAELKQALKLSKLAATNTLPVLITGESGTGKEMFAHAIHNASQRARQPFVVINCGAMPEDLIEAELFGYEPGAFTGARRGGNAGKFEQADRGTIFLDEISELSPNAQVALLRVLQEMEIVRLGSSLPTLIDVRVIAATNRDLREEVEARRFRRDLYYRLNVLSIELSPLRQRQEDIPILADAILQTVAVQLKQPKLTLSQEALEVLLAYDWPGNVRELKNVIQRAAALSESHIVGWQDLPSELKARRVEKRSGQHQAVEAVTSAQERERLLEVLRKCSGNISQASRQLGLSRMTLYRRMKTHSISKLEFIGLATSATRLSQVK